MNLNQRKQLLSKFIDYINSVNKDREPSKHIKDSCLNLIIWLDNNDYLIDEYIPSSDKSNMFSDDKNLNYLKDMLGMHD